MTAAGRTYDFLHRTEGAQAVLISYADEMVSILTACEKLDGSIVINCDALTCKLFPLQKK